MSKLSVLIFSFSQSLFNEEGADKILLHCLAGCAIRFYKDGKIFEYSTFEIVMIKKPYLKIQ